MHTNTTQVPLPAHGALPEQCALRQGRRGHPVRRLGNTHRTDQPTKEPRPTHLPIIPTNTLCTSEIEVSHWGNVAFEEFLEVQHAGAKLKGGFSRFDFQGKRCPAAFQGFVALLPHGARNIYYRDQIGNISNSEV